MRLCTLSSPSPWTAAILALTACDPTPVDDGTAVETRWVGCDEPAVTDTIMALCSLWQGACISTNGIPVCWDYTRELFTGASLPAGTPAIPGTGMAGHAHADAILCSMRELSPDLSGPVMSTAPPINIGIGEVKARQEVGFVAFDREAHAFTGYRRLEFELPVFGKVVAAAQSIKLRETSGDVAGVDAYALEVRSDQMARELTIAPPPFEIPTPVGVISVQPEFEYLANMPVIDSDYDGSEEVDVVNWLGSGTTFHFEDVYGLVPGATAALQPLSERDTRFSGWYSGIGLGTRATLPGTSPWTVPPSGPATRPDFDLFAPRETREALPSAYVRASATAHYPENPADLLPPWVFKYGQLTELDAWVELTPTLEAGAGGQFSLAVEEGGYAFPGPSGGSVGHNISIFGLDTAAQVEASFEVELTLRMLATIEFSVFGETIELPLLDVHHAIPIPIASDHTQSPQTASYGIAFDESAEVGALVTFGGELYDGPAATADFIEGCLAQDIEDHVVPKWDPEPGQASSLFEGALHPCNICIAVDEQFYGYDEEGQPLGVPANKSEVVWNAVEPPTWTCAGGHKSGCMDLCEVDPDTGEFHVVHGPAYLAAQAAAAGNADAAAHYAGCL